MACQRQVDDLARQRSEDFPFHFDEDAGERVCEFIECLSHVTGRWAIRKAGNPAAHLIRLEPWQSFCLTVPFGWKRADGFRRFREVIMLEPRKNGKSTIEAGVGLYLMCAEGEEGAQAYCGATSLDQALYVFKPAWLMVARDEDFKGALGLSLAGTPENPRGIYQNGTNSFFRPMIGDPGDGGAPHCAIVDEYHEHADDGQAAAMRLGMGAREQPMLRIISTAGVDISGPCYQKQVELQQILSGVARADDVWGIIYTVDDDDPWDALDSAIKANPNYGVSIQANQVQSELEEARRNPSKQAAYKTKRLNIWVGSRAPFFNLEKWLGLTDKTLREEDFADCECWAATDAASKLDLSSTIKVFRRTVDGRAHYYLFGRHYLPRERIYSPDNPNKQYIAWAEHGQLIATEGNATDLQLIEDDIRRDAERFTLQSWSFDPAYLTQMSQRLDADGVQVIEVAQTWRHLSSPMKEWQALIEDGRVHHDGDPVLAWAVGNVTARPDANENVFPRKEKAEQKIDPAVAGIMALGRALLDGGGVSIYESREPFVL